MSASAQVWFGNVTEDSSFSILARVCALQGTGEQVFPREGNCLKQADVSSITCKVFALGTSKTNPAGTPVSPDPTLTPAANILDALETNGWDTESDPAGYNFRYDINGTSYVPAPGEFYRFEVKFTLTGGGVFPLIVVVKTLPIQTS